MPPFSFSKSTKIFSIIDFRRHRFFDRFWHRFFHDFCSIWEANLGPCWPHFRLKWGGPNLKPPSFLLGLCYFSILGTSWPPLGAIWPRFWRVWDSILEGLGLDFGSFWCPFYVLPRKLCLEVGWWGYAKRKEFKRTQLSPIHQRTNQAPCGYASAYRIE